MILQRILCLKHTPMDDWKLTLLRIVDSLGGTATTQDIYRALEEDTFRTLTEHDVRMLEGENRHAFRHRVTSYLYRFTRGENPDLMKTSRGVYRITMMGRQRLSEAGGPLSQAGIR